MDGWMDGSQVRGVQLRISRVSSGKGWLKPLFCVDTINGWLLPLSCNHAKYGGNQLCYAETRQWIVATIVL